MVLRGTTMDKKIKKIIEYCKESGITKPEQIQYIVATVWHETDGTFKPVREAGWLRNWDKYLRTNSNTKRYYPYYGRGFVQITWKKNYEKFSKIMGIDLVNNPDLALEFDNALFILVYGMKHGTFTGKKLLDYFNINGSDFIGARAIINGKDRAEKIARYAQRIKLNEYI